MSLDIDPEQMRQMANDVRRNADTIEAIIPIAGEQRDNARQLTRNCELAVKVQETLEAFDSVMRYEVEQIRNFCTDTDFVAGVQEDLDRQIAAGIAEQAPR